jgi:RNA methyltransferase, TrmH family
MDLITSRQNPKIKQIRSLDSRKQRDKQGVFVVEGIRHVGEAVESGTQIEYLLHAPELLTSDYAFGLITRLEMENVPVFSTTPEVFADLAGKDHPQGILAVVRQQMATLSALNSDSFRWGVAIETPQDPGNLGTILRTLDAAGADGLIVLGGGTDIFHPTAVRASMGSLFWKPVVYSSLEEFHAWQNVHQYHIYGSSAKGAVDYRKVDYQRPGILLLGSEREGLTDDALSLCESVARLPMHGRATSLNLAVAAGILIYHIESALQGEG